MLYHNKVTLSHTPVQRLEDLARNFKNGLLIIIIIITNFYTGLKNPSVCNTVVLGVLYVPMCKKYFFFVFFTYLNLNVSKRSTKVIGSCCH